MEFKVTDLVKNVVLAGIGAAAVTTEKAKDVADELVKKGSLTVEQGKVLNEELKHNIKETFENKKNKDSSVEELLSAMTPDQIEALKELLNKAAKPQEEKATSSAEAKVEEPKAEEAPAPQAPEEAPTTEDEAQPKENEDE